LQNWTPGTKKYSVDIPQSWRTPPTKILRTLLAFGLLSAYRELSWGRGGVFFPASRHVRFIDADMTGCNGSLSLSLQLDILQTQNFTQREKLTG